MSAVGVASPSAHGQAMISTATAAVNASRRVAGRREPADERRERDRDHDRDEDRRHAVDEPLDRRLAGLRLGDEAGDLRERRVGADPRRAHDEAPEGVDRRAGDLGARADLDGHRLAGQHRLVDRRERRPRRRRRSRSSRRAARRTGRRPRASLDRRRRTSSPSRRTRASFAPSSSSARIAAPTRRRARASRKRPSRMSVVITRRDLEVGVARRRARRGRRPTSAQAASVPIEISVSIVAAPCRAFSERRAVERPARPRGRPASRARARAHSQPSNCSGGTIASTVERHGQRGRGDEPRCAAGRVASGRSSPRRGSAPGSRPPRRRDQVVDGDAARVVADRRLPRSRS